MADPVIVPLSSPVMLFGEDLEEVEFREPLGKDIRQLGFPFKIHEDESVEPLAGTIAKYMARLSKMTPATVDALSAPDFNECMTAVMGFFGNAPATSTTSKPSQGTSPEPSEDLPATP